LKREKGKKNPADQCQEKGGKNTPLTQEARSQPLSAQGEWGQQSFRHSREEKGKKATINPFTIKKNTSYTIRTSGASTKKGVKKNNLFAITGEEEEGGTCLLLTQTIKANGPRKEGKEKTGKKKTMAFLTEAYFPDAVLCWGKGDGKKRGFANCEP